MKAARPQQILNPRRIREILESYHSPLPEGIECSALKYMELLSSWGEKMSLTSLRDPEEIVRFHFGESIFALSLEILPKSRLADVGTGAGFPGLALKLAEPTMSLTLIEPNKKKSVFLHEVVRSLELKEVRIIAAGYEVTETEHKSLDVVTCRALSADELLLKWAEEALVDQGRVLLWLGAEDCARVRGIAGWRWHDPVLILGTKSRYILSGKLRK